MKGSLLQYLRTLRHLRADQIGWRLRYRIQRALELRSGPLLEQRLERRAKGARRSPDPMPDLSFLGRGGKPLLRLAELERGRLTLLERTHPFSGEDDWAGPCESTDQERLWTFTLHYHEWLLDLVEVVRTGPETAAARAESLLADLLVDWLDTCRPGHPEAWSFAWNSFTIATRIGSWVRLLSEAPPGLWARHAQLERRLLRSLAMQAAYLADHLEWDLRGNHLLRDAVGLAWAGRFLEHDEAAEWIDRATLLAARQAEEQLLPDGGHFERSPMYHVHVMEDLLTLTLLVRDAGTRDRLVRAWTRMAETLAWLRHPDEEIPLFNDSAMGHVPEPPRMLAWAGRIGATVDPEPRRGGRFFPDMGMAVWHGNPWSVFLDVGEVGPSYQPGHAHADTLSVEVSYREMRLIVDPGTYGYDRDRRRSYDRSTKAHNTVTVDDEDSTEVWHIFRVGRRAHPRKVNMRAEGDGMTVRGTHDGYDWLPGAPRHHRTLHVEDGRALEITDEVTGTGAHRVEGGFLLDPDWTVVPDSSGWLLRHEAGNRAVRARIEGAAGLEVDVEERPYHPRMGVEVGARRLTWRFSGRLPCRVRTSFEPAGS